MSTYILVEDAVLPQLLTPAIEAYEVEHRTHARGRGKLAIETYGLLWGYVIPARNGYKNRVICTMATVETSALRAMDWVQPNMDSLRKKTEFIQNYWPKVELIGTFHSHPYENLAEVNNYQGWRASGEDLEHWPWVHKELAPGLSHMAHFIVTITGLQRNSSHNPRKLKNGEKNTGFVFSAERRRFWIKAYSSEVCDSDEESFFVNEDVFLEIPSLSTTFENWV